MATNALLLSLFTVVVFSRQELWVEYSYAEPDIFQKYFHRLRQGYFVDLGGFNPIALSNTVKLSNWNGIILQANEERAGYLRDFEPNLQIFNLAVSDATTGYTPFFEADQPSASSLSAAAIKGKPTKELKVMTISISDLCHKYYKVKPKLMNIDIEGIEENVLKSNDWATEKCVPELIFVEDQASNQATQQTSITQYLTGLSYKMFEQVGINKVFIHSSVLDFYQRQVEANAAYVKNHETVRWDTLSISLAKLIGKPFDPIYNPNTHLAFVQIRQPTLINIVEINKHSNMISKVGLNRPIIILEYNREFSRIFVGTEQYTIEDIKIDSYEFKKIRTQANGKELLVYVFNHYKHSDFRLQIVSSRGTLVSIRDLYQQISDDLPYFIIATIIVTNLVLLITFVIYRKYTNKASRGCHLQTSSNDYPSSLSDAK